MAQSVKLFEILVPTRYNTGKPVRTKHHKEWDKVVRKVAGGLTILTPVKGQWKYNNDVYAERMIPVRIACTDGQIKKIAEFSIGHYKQEAVMYYALSNQVFFVEK